MLFGLAACGRQTVSTPESGISSEAIDSTQNGLTEGDFLDGSTAFTNDSGWGGTGMSVTNTEKTKAPDDLGTTVLSTAACTTTSPVRTTTRTETTTIHATVTTAAQDMPAPVRFTLKTGHQYIGHVKTLFEYGVYDGHSIVQGGTFDGIYYSEPRPE